MSDGKIQVEMTIEQSRAFFALQQLAQQQTKVEKGFSGVGDKSRSAESELKRFAERTKQIVATPMEKYADQTKRLDAALKAGLLTQEQFGRATKKAGEELQGAGKAGEESFGSKAVAQVAAYAASFSAVQLAIQLTIQSLQNLKAERDRALGIAESIDENDTKLAGLSGGDVKKFQAMRKERDEAFVKYGAKREVVGEAVFTANSGEFTKRDKEAMLEYAGIGSMATAATLIQKSNEVYGKSISGEAALNVANEAARKTQASPEDLARNMPTVMESAKAAGYTMQEATAIVAKFGDVFKNVDEGATIARSLFKKQAADDKLRGTGIAGMDQLLTNEKNTKSFMKDNSELQSAVNVFRESREKISGLVNHLNAETKLAGTPNDSVTSHVRARYSDPLQRALLEKRQAEARDALAVEDRYAVGAAGTKTALLDVNANLNKQGRHMAYRSGAWAAGGVAELLGMGPATAATLARMGGSETDGGVSDSWETLKRAVGNLPGFRRNTRPDLTPPASDEDSPVQRFKQSQAQTTEEKIRAHNGAAPVESAMLSELQKQTKTLEMIAGKETNGAKSTPILTHRALQPVVINQNPLPQRR